MGVVTKLPPDWSQVMYTASKPIVELRPLPKEGSVMMPYPTTVPTNALDMVIATLRGNPPPTATAIHAIWQVLGFCLGQLLPDTTPAPVQPLSHSEVVSHLAVLQQHGVLSALPWQQIIATLLTVLGQLLGKQGV